MKDSDFLSRLEKDRRLERVEPSEAIAGAYLGKARDSLRSAKLLLDNGLYDNSIALSYYVMYDSLTALLSRAGIKCESHTGSICLLDELFEQKRLQDIIKLAKRERVDKQYYVASAVNMEINRRVAGRMLKEAEEFMTEMRQIMDGLSYERMEQIRSKLGRLLD